MHNQKEICLLPIPFSDLTSQKRRPVLIISNSEYNRKSEDILVMAITSNLQTKENTILISQEDMRIGNLKSESLIRIDKIYSINKELITKTFGEIDSGKFNMVLDKLLVFLKES